MERSKRQRRFVRIVSATVLARLGVGETRSSLMPVRGQFVAASAAGSVSSGSVRASVTQNSRHGGAQEKQEAKRCKDRIWMIADVISRSVDIRGHGLTRSAISLNVSAPMNDSSTSMT